MSRRRRKSKIAKVNLRKAYNLSGLKCPYSRFVREKVIPVIGESALHPLPRRKGSRENEWWVTKNNFARVLREHDYRLPAKVSTEQVDAVTQFVAQHPDAGGTLILSLVEMLRERGDEDSAVALVQPSENELVYCIPIHPFSNNHQYEYTPRGSGVRCTDKYNEWKRDADALLAALVQDGDREKIDWTQPVHVDYHFRHLARFDTMNFIKSAQDVLGRVFAFDDKRVKSSNVSAEDASGYDDGHILFTIRQK